MHLSHSDSLKENKLLEWGHYVVILISFMLTLTAWYVFKQQQQEKLKLRFEQESNQIISHVLERMRHYEDALWAGVANIKSSREPVNFSHWKSYVEHINIIQKYPGINGIGVIYRVPPENIKSFTAKIRREGQPSFEPHPKHQRSIYFPITYIIPVKGNEQAVGLDMSHEDNRFNAIIKSGETHSAQITGPIVLVQDAKKTPGFLFYAPFYNGKESTAETFEGVVYAPFIVSKLLDGVLSEAKRNVSIKITDAGETIYDELKAYQQDHFGDELHLEKQVSLYGRTWGFDIHPNEQFISFFESKQPLLVLFAGLMIDALIIFLFIAINNSKRRAVRYAKVLNKELISNQEELEEANMTLKSILDNAKNIVIIQTDDEGRILFANKSIESLVRKSAGSICGESLISALALKADSGESVNDFNQMIDGLGSHNDFTMQLSGDTLKHIHISHSKICKEESVQYIFVLSDTTSEVEREQLKNDFIAVLNHELRTPLTTINGSLHLLQHSLDSNPEKCRELVEVARQNGKQLLALINDVLSISRMESGECEYHLETFNLNELITDTVNQFKTVLDNKRIDLELDLLPATAIRSDNQRLAQVITNIISNAVKFTKSKIRISMQDEQEKHCYRVSIHDDGIGISEAFKKNLFNKFSQEDGRANRKAQGTGLGLYIAKTIMTHLGGDIIVESELDQGATFTLIIPKQS